MIKESISLEELVDGLNQWVEQDREKALAMLDGGGMDFLNRMFGFDAETDTNALEYTRKKGFMARPLVERHIDPDKYANRRERERLLNWESDTLDYSLDEKRVARYLVEISGIGGGGDPVGFLMASHASLRHLKEPG